MTSSGDYRIGHAERDHVVGELRRAAEDGRLTAEELDERIARARAARTAAELAPLVADLGSTAATGVQLPVVGQTAASALTELARIGYSPDAPLMLNAGLSGTKREGVWVVPPYLRAQAGVETVRLNCLQASAATEVIQLDVQGVMGTVVLVLPEGWAVNVDQLSPAMGTIKVKVPGVPAPGCPVFIVRGSLGMGTFKARGPNWWDRRRHGLQR